MSYLDIPRINFSGRFYTNVSTINNDIANYSRTSIPERDQGWNPDGTANFKFDSCTVTGVEAEVDGADVLGAAVETPASPVPGKLVDIDPDAQALSQVIGLQVSVTTEDGAGFSGRLTPCNFLDMWTRSPTGQGNAGGQQASAIYISVLTDVSWHDIDKSKLIKELHDQAWCQQVAIRFIVDSYFFGEASDPDSGYGRVTGAFGPYKKGDPVQFAQRRMVLPAAARGERPGGHEMANLFRVQGAFFGLDTEGQTLTLDLGNSFQIQEFNGPPVALAPLRAAVLNPDGSVDTPIDPPFDFTADTYDKKSGIVQVDLSQDQCDKLKGAPAAVQIQVGKNSWKSILAESLAGEYFNISPFTSRAIAGDPVPVELWGFQWGEPLEQTDVQLVALVSSSGGDPSALEITGSPGSRPGHSNTGDDGVAPFSVQTSSEQTLPTNRTPLDSLCYILDGPWRSWAAMQLPPSALLVWNQYEARNPT